MQILPAALESLIEALGNLPGVGSRTAERYAYFLVRRDPAKSQQIAQALSDLHKNVKYCPKTFTLIDAESDVSELYSDPRRDRTIVAVVAEPLDIVALEKIGSFRGTYHVLGGLVSPIDSVTPEQLHITELIKRIDEDNVVEIIFATNASVEGESTALYIQQQIGDRPLKITRLARGLPIGVDLEYADQITLSRALDGRQTL
ncbi:recombination protein RecR [Candidatus Saccharibacteria bacterium]|nr:MAG: recombination protein RecR [Candidatus Saccharibacteria bacterium]